MDPTRIVTALEGGPAIIRALVQDLPPEDLIWQPSPERWSVRDVLCHLLDEERLDFRVRLDYMLHRPGEPCPPIDPQGWVAAHDYAAVEAFGALEAWEAERRCSLAWLRSLGQVDYTTSLEEPWGRIAAGDMLAAWAAHDTFHQRQIVRLRYARLEVLASPYSLRYAGDW